MTEKDREELERLEESWVAEYGIDGRATASLLERVVLDDWFLKRAVRRYREMEARLGNIPVDEWSAEDIRKMDLLSRHKTTAERSFDRSFGKLEALRKDRRSELERTERQLNQVRTALRKTEDQAIKKGVEIPPIETVDAPGSGTVPLNPMQANPKKPAARPVSRAKELFTGSQAKKNQRKIHTLEQWAEITRQDGMTRTELFPSNEELIEMGKKMDPPPELVYRRLNFVHGVPPEYQWAASDPERRVQGGCGIQRMTVDTWLAVIEREKAEGSGHIGPCGGNLPRPEERGGCDCSVCTENARILAEREGEALE